MADIIAAGSYAAAGAVFWYWATHGGRALNWTGVGVCMLGLGIHVTRLAAGL